MSSPPPTPSKRGHPSPIADALDTNAEAAAEVKDVADELAVVHAVLDTKLTRGASDAEVRKAVADTDELEKRLGQTAEKLDTVNGTLQREVRRS